MTLQAIEIINEAYRKHVLDEVATFDETLEFPFNIALNTLNDVVRIANKQGPYWFNETRTALPFNAASYTYAMSFFNINPKQIKFIRKEAADKWGELLPYNHREFMRRFRISALQTAEPSAFTRFGDTLELNTQPDVDYSLYCYHFADMPLVEVTTDVFLVPETDEDILIESCFQILGARIGRWTMQQAEAEIKSMFQPFLAEVRSDTAMPTQMPSAF